MKLAVPYDGSEFSLEALPFADRLASETQGEIVLVSIVEPLDTPGAAQNLENRLASVSSRVSVPVSYTVKEKAGNPVDGILEAVDDTGAELIVMSTHGTTGLATMIQGSVANGLVKSGKVPVLLIRPSDLEGQGSRA